MLFITLTKTTAILVDHYVELMILVSFETSFILK